MEVVERMIAVFEGNAAPYLAAVQAIDRANAHVAQSVQAAIAQVQSVGRSAVGALAAVGVSLSGIGAVRWAVGLAAGTEVMTANFETLLGSAERARNMVADLQRFADTTPLRMPGVTEAANTLLAMNVSANNVLPALRMLGDIAQGDDARLKSLAIAFGEVVQAGHLQGIQERMFIQSGHFSVVQEIARTTGRDSNEIREAMHRGQISVQMVADALASATSAGGRFFGSMARGSQTLTGLWSTAMDNVAGVARTVGNVIEEQFRLKDVARGVSDVAQSVKAFVDGMSPDFKRFAAALAGAVIGTVALAVAFYALRTYGGMLFNPVTAGMALVAIGIATLITRAGGLGQAIGAVRYVLRETWDRVSEAIAPVLPLVGAFAAGFAVAAYSVVMFASGIAGAVADAVSGIGDFLASNRELFVIAGAVTAVVLIAAVAFKVFSVAAGIAGAILSATGVVQTVNTAIWIVWTAVVVAAKVAMLVWSGVVAIATIGTWAWNAALTVMNFLLSPVAILGAAAAVVVLGAAIGGVAAVVGGAFAAAGALFNVLTNFPTASGPIAAIGGMFREWGEILMSVVRVAQTDLPGAWSIFQAGADLATAQMRAMWPPIWQFLKTGFTALWTLVGTVFDLQFDLIALKAKNALRSALGLSTEAGEAAAAAAEEATRRAITTAVGRAAAEFGEAATTFDTAIAASMNTEAIEAARRAARTAEIMQIFAEEELVPAVPPVSPAVDQWQEGFAGIGQVAEKAKRAVSELRGVLAGSAADASIVAAYLDMLNDAPAHRPVPAGTARAGRGTPVPAAPGAPVQVADAGGGAPPAVAVAGGGGGPGLTDVVAVLRLIHQQLRDSPGLTIEDANVANA